MSKKRQFDGTFLKNQQMRKIDKDQWFYTKGETQIIEKERSMVLTGTSKVKKGKMWEYEYSIKENVTLKRKFHK
jgi:hypothetical protein